MFDLGEEVYLGNENLFEFGCILSSLIFTDGVAILLLKKSPTVSFCNNLHDKKSWEVLR